MSTTGAATPGEITHCFVLKGHDLVWSMLEGLRCPVSGKLEKSKDIENRHGRLAPGWYGVILGKSTKGVTRERYEACKKELVGCQMPPWKWKDLDQYMGCVVGIVRVAHSLPHEICQESFWAEGPVCNIISHAGWIGRPIPCKGNLGACPIKDPEALRQVREYAEISFRDGEILDTGAEKRFPYQGPSAFKKKPTKACIDLRDKDEVGNLRDFLVTSIANMKRKREELLDKEGQQGVTSN